MLNDLNGDLVTFYRCARFHADTLLTELEFVLNSREEFHDFADQSGLTDIQRASRWFFRNRNCFRGANLGTFGTGPEGSAASGSRQARMQAIRELNVRLDRVIVENLDWQKVFDLYDRAGSFFFCDPPYTECNAGQYGTWNNADVLRFRERLGRLKGGWLVTFNDSPSIRPADLRRLRDSERRARERDHPGQVKDLPRDHHHSASGRPVVTSIVCKFVFAPRFRRMRVAAS